MAKQRQLSIPGYCLLTFIALMLLISGANCKSVTLEILPREVIEQGHNATLRCHYDLEGAKLYSLKWYRGNSEIYRYSPGLVPPIQTFNNSWIKIDLRNSTKDQVVIRDVDFLISGNYSCEATADSPYFYTEQNWKVLTVVSVPKDKPVIMSERSHYSSGDTLKANCSTALSKPSVKLSFTLNGLQVGETITKEFQEKHDYSGYSAAGGRSPHPGKQWSEISLQLEPFHFNNGQLNLRCIAKIQNIYEQASEVVHLGNGLREPVPERVTSKMPSINYHRIADLIIVGLVMLHLLLR